uniref:Uncharacterized protein n=1 Tax=Candidatus Kentrum sp. TUN TaxID=2126343 RepID=A0A451AKP5_9GAMM|nr:MAG: hypothetical protein BECKTUN1418D_GA0071000_10525 [Candidatus Kentron sp. TUN]VFK57908.1 MAG: hypothetical protein BECKTUN1418F_GA0071002_11295 [Candidatus Kentron sp. TUN]VFK66597.1 MAG: hypothetical protein BECKTUN1418E_GA0071001_11236 [Candidatus Kentron sp. TUN]
MYRKNKNLEETDMRNESHPPLVLARSANMFTGHRFFSEFLFFRYLERFPAQR